MASLNIESVKDYYEIILEKAGLSPINLKKDSTKKLIEQILFLKNLSFSLNESDNKEGGKTFECEKSKKKLGKIIFFTLEETKEIIISKIITSNLKVGENYKLLDSKLIQISSTLSKIPSQKGIGSRLLYKFLVLAKEKGYKTVTLQSKEGAEGFYDKLLSNLEYNNEFVYEKLGMYYEIQL